MIETNMEPLIEDYITLTNELLEFNKMSQEDIPESLLHETLVSNGEWSYQGAEQLIFLAKEYGAFFLRNAFALAIALNIEDGEMGF